MAPAHPEMIAAEAELEVVRHQLAQTPEFVGSDSAQEPPVNHYASSEDSADARIARAEQDLHRAEQKLESALEAERRALAALLTPPQPDPVVVANSAEQLEAAAPRDAGWELAGIAAAALLLLLITRQPRSGKASPQSSPEPALMLSPAARRNIYDSADQRLPPAANQPLQRRAPVVPRRRAS
jgi:predicted NBD/HSP70 family sugar kinase